LIKGSSKPLEKNSISSSFGSFHSYQEVGFSNIHTNLLVIECILQELTAKGEESLAKHLSKFYKTSYFPSFPPEESFPFKLVPSDSNPKPVEESTSSHPLITLTINMVRVGYNLTKMWRILVAIYAPLNLANPPSAMPTGDYQKYMPKFTREGDVTAEEHIEVFYSYAENLNIEEEDVCSKLRWPC